MGNDKKPELKGIEKAGAEFHWKEEEFEEANEVYVKTNYPEPSKKFRVVFESFSLSMEETYFWINNQLKYDLSFPTIDKITDIFSSSENSSFWGQSAQRLGIQQDRITNTLATLGKMVKDLFALVRELRIIDEKMEAYSNWNKKSKAADATLKETFINFVENQGGQMKTSSVYGLATNLGYTTLPDWFFNTRIWDKDDIDKTVDALPTNNNLKNVIRRKLFEFIVWKEQTEREMKHRRTFNIHYLRQHWGIIKMYMGWMKPYLRNVKRLTMNEDQVMSPDIISAFETAALEVEILAYDKTKAAKGASHCVLVTFKYYVKPSLSYQQPESYQRGAIHVGKVEISMRSYGWSADEIAAYKKYRQDEEMELLSVIDASLKSAMDALSDDLDKYLAESGEEEFKKKKEEAKKDYRNALQKWLGMRSVDATQAQSMNIFEPFLAIFGGFGEILGSFVGGEVGPKSANLNSKARKDAAKMASSRMWLLLKNYKKSHQLLTW